MNEEKPKKKKVITIAVADGGLLRKKYAVGERKPEPAAEVEPEKTQAPVSPPKKAAQAADATDIGDFEGLDDALFEIFNVDKPISIKVKSSSPRLRAKITEKK